MATILLFVCLLLHLAISFCWMYTDFFFRKDERLQFTLPFVKLLASSYTNERKKTRSLGCFGTSSITIGHGFLNIYEILKNKSKNFAANTSRRDLHGGWELTVVLPIFSQIHLFCVGWKELESSFLPLLTPPCRNLPRQD